jgi:hypothetical protein
MSLYQLVMRRRDGVPDEVRYHDRPLKVGQVVDIGGKLWIVADAKDTTGRLQDPSGASITARYVLARPSSEGHGDSVREAGARRAEISSETL